MIQSLDNKKKNKIGIPHSTLVLGGSRSGKSEFAENLVTRQYDKKTYVATMQAGDDELQMRIIDHKKRRGEDWNLIEEPLLLCKVLTDENNSTEVFLIDCITMWLSNMLMKNFSDFDIAEQVKQVGKIAQQRLRSIVFVANEVGMGIVPESQLSRRFRDLAGWTNQELATACDDVFFVAAGCPLQLK
jgi:adenosylcobinamide kinase/adenosylcobinamide-phosphate guanylyltransferase